MFTAKFWLVMELLYALVNTLLILRLISITKLYKKYRNKKTYTFTEERVFSKIKTHMIEYTVATVVMTIVLLDNLINNIIV